MEIDEKQIAKRLCEEINKRNSILMEDLEDLQERIELAIREAYRAGLKKGLELKK